MATGRPDYPSVLPAGTSGQWQAVSLSLNTGTTIGIGAREHAGATAWALYDQAGRCVQSGTSGPGTAFRLEFPADLEPGIYTLVAGVPAAIHVTAPDPVYLPPGSFIGGGGSSWVSTAGSGGGGGAGFSITENPGACVWGVSADGWRGPALERLRIYDEAAKTALQLLRDHLPPKQQEYLDGYGFFAVRGSAGGRYLITLRASAFNVVSVCPDGTLDRSWCAGPPGHLPPGDYALAQKLVLQSDEEWFLRKANRSTTGYWEVCAGNLPGKVFRQAIRSA